jgi:hypothetical protein
MALNRGKFSRFSCISYQSYKATSKAFQLSSNDGKLHNCHPKLEKLSLLSWSTLEKLALGIVKIRPRTTLDSEPKSSRLQSF